MLRAALEPDGYKVRTATSGDEALAIAKCEPPQLFLLDVSMPGVGGFELCRRIKKDLGLSDIPVIFISAKSDTHQKVEGFRAGGVDYITKPVIREEVAARIKVHLVNAELNRRFAWRNRRLKREVVHRKLVEQELQKVLSMATSANAAKSNFLANISHELRTPMHAIRSFARLGIDKADTAAREKLARYFSRIDVSSQRLLGLINNLLDLSKLEAGSMDFDKEENDLAQVVAVAHDELRGLLDEKSLNLNSNTPERPITAQFDFDKTLQVVRNLISNAIRFAPEGSAIEIQVGETVMESSDHPDDGAMVPAVYLTVSDRGEGISPGEIDTVFDKFVQAAGVRSAKGGTGLGLAICDELVRGHGGNIWAENNVDGGARFTFVIPRECSVETKSA